MKLAGDLAGAYSRRINIQHRLVYQVLEFYQDCQSFENVDSLRLNFLVSYVIGMSEAVENSRGYEEFGKRQHSLNLSI